MNLYLYALLENLVVFGATVGVCWATSSPWGLICLIGLTWVKRHKKDDKDGEE